MLSLRKDQILVCLTLLFLAMFLIPTIVHADSGNTYYVGTSKLNLRTTPSDTGQVVGQLNFDDQVVVFKEFYGWAQTYYNEQEVWVASQYLYTKNEEKHDEIEPEEFITITDNGVWIRTGPSTKHNVIDSTNKGNSYRLLATDNGWHKVALDNNSTGWVATSLTDIGASGTPSESIEASKSIKNNHSNKTLNGYNIVLDPGHGGNDPGTTGQANIFEKDLILTTANKAAERLREAGATVIMTRTNDKFLSLEERVAISNSYYTHAFISLHYDAYPQRNINGFSTHYYTSSGNDHKLANEIQSSLEHHLNLSSRGVMQNDYHVLRENRDLAVLVELGFMTNATDLSIIQTADYQNRVSKGITDGLLNYFHN